MIEIVIYTKEDCERCNALKLYLTELNLPFIEKDIDKDEVVQELLRSEFILSNFCDEEQCVVVTPIVKLNGQWKLTDFYDEKGTLLKEDVKKMLKSSSEK
ncbi:MAG: glutaredoxin domain-containing protein [Candidatus Helarchaeota archaeon]